MREDRHRDRSEDSQAADLERARQMGAHGSEIVGDEWTVATMQRKTRQL